MFAHPFIIAAIAVATFASLGSAQLPSVPPPSSDYLFANAGGSLVTASTGIPYLGITEYAYGISSKTTIGLMFGETPDVEGYGIRIRTVIAELSDNNRIYFRAPILYYPKTHELGGYPWFLAWPVLNLEHEYQSGMCVWAGMGAVGAGSQCTVEDGLGLDKDDDMDTHSTTSKGFEGGVWNTVQFGASQPIGEKFVAQAEFGLVMSGVKLALSSNWVGGTPVLLIMGVTYAL